MADPIEREPLTLANEDEAARPENPLQQDADVTALESLSPSEGTSPRWRAR